MKMSRLFAALLLTVPVALATPSAGAAQCWGCGEYPDGCWGCQGAKSGAGACAQPVCGVCLPAPWGCDEMVSLDGSGVLGPGMEWTEVVSTLINTQDRESSGASRLVARRPCDDAIVARRYPHWKQVAARENTRVLIL